MTVGYNQLAIHCQQWNDISSWFNLKLLRFSTILNVIFSSIFYLNLFLFYISHDYTYLTGWCFAWSSFCIIILLRWLKSNNEKWKLGRNEMSRFSENVIDCSTPPRTSDLCSFSNNNNHNNNTDNSEFV